MSGGKCWIDNIQEEHSIDERISTWSNKKRATSLSQKYFTYKIITHEDKMPIDLEVFLSFYVPLWYHLALHTD